MADAVDAGSSKIGQGASGTAASDSAPSAARRLTAYLSQHATAVVTTTLVGILTASAAQSLRESSFDSTVRISESSATRHWLPTSASMRSLWSWFTSSSRRTGPPFPH
jgi:hypothetical protein